MKLAHILTEDDRSVTLRKLALRLQTELQESEHLGAIVDEIELHHGEAKEEVMGY